MDRPLYALVTVALLSVSPVAQADPQGTPTSPWAQPAPAAPPALPAPLPPIRPAARRRMSYSVGLLAGAAIPLTGSVSRNLSPGPVIMLGGSDEFSSSISGRLELGVRYHGAAVGDAETAVLIANMAVRFYLLRDVAARPYVGAHTGYQIGIGDGAASSGPLMGISLGASAGLVYHLSDEFALNAEGRFEGILGVGGGDVVTGSMLSLMGGVTAFIP